ncbi:hypothetical protein [Nostoc punctiforme]|uniref:hypothetical protein n=1 Tax=Nostoc punctiforme TaxID=272131 RepID=UPI000045C19B|nr:hypothetical protein [Nostoc punctiforme]
MSKAYPSNLTCAQYEFLSDLIPEPKPILPDSQLLNTLLLDLVFALVIASLLVKLKVLKLAWWLTLLPMLSE